MENLWKQNYKTDFFMKKTALTGLFFDATWKKVIKNKFWMMKIFDIEYFYKLHKWIGGGYMPGIR